MSLTHVHLENAAQVVPVGPEFKAGGIGCTHFHATHPDLLLKFDPKLDGEKVRYLVSHPLVPSLPGYSFLFPLDVALNPSTGEVVGYVMPFAQDAVDVISIIAANQWLPPHFLVRVALHHVNALLDLHRGNYLRADLPNSLVFRDGSIAEIDLDSLEIQRDRKFKALCVKPDYLPPRLIHEVPADHWFRPADDIWMLMVLLWQLLRQNQFEHPFACHGAVGRRADRVKQGRWAWSGKHPDVTPPRHAQPLDTLDAGLRDLFCQCFDTGHTDEARRPTLHACQQTLQRLDCNGSVELSATDWECVRTGRVGTGQLVHRPAAGQRPLQPHATHWKSPALAALVLVTAAAVPLLTIDGWQADPKNSSAADHTEQAPTPPHAATALGTDHALQPMHIPPSPDGTPRLWNYLRQHSQEIVP